MKVTLSTICGMLLVSCAAVPAVEDSQPAVDQRFHGRWAPNAEECLNDGPTGRVIRIDGYGWREFEDGARVVRTISATDREQHLVVTSIGGPEQREGRLVLRATGEDRIELGKHFPGYDVRITLVRCS